ncbi:response regulator transcription factor [Halalkalibacter akibai]|uniref:Two-component response regulator yesN n=1 Tax=Halalkalibacter akibai (strain ATCC 43226 / DSM 21942 / CIP 109018 / JCM 9157 / 1139) TaxID=1236973 RepID=W4QNL4_HALA3|nr:two-component response regulator yesN [Halalkalibacter akibai JCM 9157]
MGKTILIVEDEPRTRQGLKKAIELWGEGKMEVMTAENGEQALSAFDEHRIHLLITDIRMPEMTGLELLAKLEEAGHKPVTIVVSAYSEFDYAQEAIRFGVVNYLLKPVQKKKLIDAFEKALKVNESREHEGLIKKVVDSSLVELEKMERAEDSPIEKAIAYVSENLKQKLSMKTVAETVHLNPSYFSVLFKEKTNLTFSDYVTRKRIQAAKNLLIQTKIPVSDIAEEVGYQTSKYFIKMFKDYEGITPSQYRKEHEE